MIRVRLLANAKINLTLNITGKRSDGYHEIETVMQSVDLHDELELVKKTAGGILLTCNRPYLPTGRGNLAFRAAELYLARANLAGAGVHIWLRKRIPSGAGLGGGSADAAAVLHGMEALFGAGFNSAALARMGLSLGADVPFCLTGGAAVARGVGEELSPAPVLSGCFLVVAKPRESVSTAAAYAAYDSAPAPRRPQLIRMLAALQDANLRSVGKNLCNVFEETTALPAVRQLVLRMRASGAAGAGMSGSGSAVFGLFEKKKEAEACAQTLLRSGVRVFVCRPAAQGILIKGE